MRQVPTISTQSGPPLRRIPRRLNPSGPSGYRNNSLSLYYPNGKLHNHSQPRAILRKIQIKVHFYRSSSRPTRLRNTGHASSDECGIGRYARRFEQATLHVFAEGVDFVHTGVSTTNAISQLPLPGGSFHNTQYGVRDFLSISGRGPDEIVDLDGDLPSDSVRACPVFIGSLYDVSENGRQIGAGLNDRRFNSLRRQFVMVGFRQRF